MSDTPEVVVYHYPKKWNDNDENEHWEPEHYEVFVNNGQIRKFVKLRLFDDTIHRRSVDKDIIEEHKKVINLIKHLNSINAYYPKFTWNTMHDTFSKVNITPEKYQELITTFPYIKTVLGGSRRRRPSRKYKKSAKRVFRKKSRSTRRR